MFPTNNFAWVAVSSLQKMMFDTFNLYRGTQVSRTFEVLCSKVEHWPTMITMTVGLVLDGRAFTLTSSKERCDLEVAPTRIHCPCHQSACSFLVQSLPPHGQQRAISISCCKEWLFCRNAINK